MPNTVTYEIHPAIGIARLGTSRTCFLAPEPDMLQADYDQAAKITAPAKLQRRSARELDDSPLTQYREKNTALLRRQAVRFRVFKVERDAAKNVVACSEAHGPGVSIKWQVHLCNRKAAAPCFTDADGENVNQDLHYVRNADVKNRNSLIIDAGLQSPAGHDPAAAAELKGQFKGVDVLLGHAWTDGEGRLLVAGGLGNSGSPGASALSDFADNDDWYDDTSDGPVTAKVKVGNAAEVDAVAAHVVVAPFDFAPDVDSFVTLYDTMAQTAVDKWPHALPQLTGNTDFTLHVLPILMRTRGYRWVNSPTMRADVREKHAAWRPDKTNGSLFDCLGDPAIQAVPHPGTDQERLINRAISIRQMFLKHLREPAAATPVREVKMPRLHDDDAQSNEVLPLTKWQFRHMRNWAAQPPQFTRAPTYGEFACDALDRVSLEACSGGPFYPGMEVPRIVKDESIYAAPFRFDPAKAVPGFITQRLAVPWQADFYECQMDGDNGWWPATRPDKVIVNGDVDPRIMSDVMSERMEEWDNNVGGKDAMVHAWSRLGIVKRIQVAKAPRMADEFVDTNSPGYLYVEDERTLPRERERSDKPKEI